MLEKIYRFRKVLSFLLIPLGGLFLCFSGYSVYRMFFEIPLTFIQKPFDNIVGNFIFIWSANVTLPIVIALGIWKFRNYIDEWDLEGGIGYIIVGLIIAPICAILLIPVVLLGLAYLSFVLIFLWVIPVEIASSSGIAGFVFYLPILLLALYALVGGVTYSIYGIIIVVRKN